MAFTTPSIPPVGSVYELEYTVEDIAVAVSSTTLLMRDSIVLISDHGAYFGDADNQRFLRAAGSSFGLAYLDLNTLYVKNAVVGNDATLNILGTKEV